MLFAPDVVHLLWGNGSLCLVFPGVKRVLGVLHVAEGIVPHVVGSVLRRVYEKVD